MTATSSTATGSRVEVVQIARGGYSIKGSRWREAILAYLNGIWANDVVVYVVARGHPRISFNSITLRLYGGKYIGYYLFTETSGVRPDMAYEDVFVVPDPTQAEVENGLIRFVKNNQIRQLAIVFPGKGNLILTKGRKRSELFVTTEGCFPSETEIMREHGIDNAIVCGVHHYRS
jgi:hypothetical protein